MYAENLLKNLSEYQSEEAFVSMRWTNPAALKAKGHSSGLKGSLKAPSQPAPISFNLNEDL
jgi:hypothetical protein